jgi:hypothetical protein
MLGSFVIWVAVTVGVETLGNRSDRFSARNLSLWLILLPVFLLEGYLRGGWKWKDLEKKYPE